MMGPDTLHTWCVDPARVQLFSCLVLLQELLEGGHLTGQLLGHPVKQYLLIGATFPGESREEEIKKERGGYHNLAISRPQY